MRQRIDQPPFTNINRRVERLAIASGHHRLFTDAVIALGTAGVSVLGLAVQGRLSAGMCAFLAALCLPLVLRHRDARASFALIALVALAQWLLSPPQLADVTVLIALYWVCLEADAHAILLALLTAEAGAVMLALRWERQAPFKYWAAATGVAVAAAALGLMIRQRRTLLSSLSERAARLERERDQQAVRGAAAERARIAREMHDIVSHNLTVMIALADGARYALGSEPERALSAIERVSNTGRHALEEMRRLLGVLGEDSEHEPLEPQPTLERLNELITRVRGAGVPVSVTRAGDLTGLAPGVELALYRVAQEALTNTLKHASRPVAAHLELRRSNSEIELEVVNTGAPATCAPGGEGRGLRGMRERAYAYGGELDAGPTGDGRWRVHLRLRTDAKQQSRQLGGIR